MRAAPLALARGLLPAVTLALLLDAIVWQQPRTQSYFGLTHASPGSTSSAPASSPTWPRRPWRG